MTLTQAWVGYLDRSYETIKKSCLNRLSSIAPEISDHSESNPLIIILSMFSGIAEVIHLYLDSFAREAFLGTARKYASVIKLVKLIDYPVKARSYATVDLLFTIMDDNANEPGVLAAPLFIPAGTLIYPKNSTIPFRTIQDTTIPAGKSSAYISAGQFTEVFGSILGNTAGSQPNQSFPLPNKYVHGSLVITVQGNIWPLYNFQGLMASSTQGVVVEIDEEAEASVVFGDGVNGAIPPNGQTVFGDYLETEGVLGNLPPNTITELQSVITLPAGFSLDINNPGYSSGGSDFEDIEKIRDLAPRSLRTLDRAVTYQDYKDIALQVPGVGASEVSYCCGKYVDVYVAPNSQGIATTALVNKVRNYMDCRVMITTRVQVYPAGVTRIWIKATIYGKPLADDVAIRAQVLNKLDEVFGVNVPEINKNVSITNIINEVEALSLVETIEIEEVRIEPYARPIGSTNNILNIEYPILPHTTDRATWRLVYKAGGPTFDVYKNGLFHINVGINQTFNDNGKIAFKPLPGTYQDLDTWEFVVFPSYPEIFPDTIIEIDDFSAPIIEVSPFINEDTPRTIFSDLTIEEQGSSVNCLPPCN